jgi:hypothetical protein
VDTADLDQFYVLNSLDVGAYAAWILRHAQILSDVVLHIRGLGSQYAQQQLLFGFRRNEGQLFT